MLKHPSIIISLLASGSLLAGTSVKFEYGVVENGTWKFPSIISPSQTDTARRAKVSLASGILHPGGAPVTALNDGVISATGSDPADAVFFDAMNPDGGGFLMDLGFVQPIREINSYSFHEWDKDQGGRTPQVYTLYASAAETADPANLAAWTRIVEVDSRPNKSGEGWGNHPQAVRIADSAGKDLGNFRYLLWVVKPTLSPLTRIFEGPGNTSSHTFFTEIDVHTAAKLANSKPAFLSNSNVEEIIVIIKTHFDLGYTHRVKDLLEYYRTSMIDKAMDAMDQSKSLPPDQQMSWTGPGWVMDKVSESWPGQTPARQKRIDDFFKSGKFITHALPFTVESDLLDPENFARGYQSSSMLSRRYGLELPRDAKMTDVPSHGGILATALAQGGVKFMHIGCNWPSAYVKVPPLFWWEGPDGSRVLTIYTPGYGTSTAFNPWGGTHEPCTGKNFMPAPRWPYKVWPAIVVTPDNSGPSGAAGVKSLIDEAKAKFPGVKIRMGRMADFADAIIKSGVELPVVKAEMPDTWIHGCMCDPGGMKTARNIHPLMPAAEALNTQLCQWGLPLADPVKDISKAYEQSLLYSEHTWGGMADVKQYGEAFHKLPPDSYKDLEGSWEDKTDYIRTAARIIHPLLETNLAQLAKHVKADGKRTVVYNPLPWTRSGIVEVDGKPFLAKDVPASGYKTYPGEIPDPISQISKPETTTLENPFFKISLDPAKGTISSLVDKRTGREWVDAAADQGLGQYLNERFTFEQTLNYTKTYQQGRAGYWHPGMHKPGMISEKQVPYRAASPAEGTIRISRSGIAQSAILDLPADPANHLPGAALRVTLLDDQPYVDLEITLKDKARDNWPEADWLCLPFKVNNPTFRVGRALGMMNPADILPDANRDLYAVGSGVTLTDADGSGIAVCPLDHPLVSLDRPGCWKFSSADFVPKKPVVYLNLYNNQWNTNYRYWYSGTWSSRVRLWTFGKDATTESALVTPSLEARIPLMAATADENGGTLLPEQAGITTSRKGIQVTAFGTDFDGNPGTLLRLWEQGGVAGDLTITFPAAAKYTTATPVNLRGENTGDPAPITNGTLTFKLGAYAPASFTLN